MVNKEEKTRIAVYIRPGLARQFFKFIERGGFSTISEALRTLMRDCISGVIVYKDGVIQRKDR